MGQAADEHQSPINKPIAATPTAVPPSSAPVAVPVAVPVALWAASLGVQAALGARFALAFPGAAPRTERLRREGTGGPGLRALTAATEPALRPLRPVLDAGLLKQ